MIAPYLFQAESNSLKGVLSIGFFDIPFSVFLMIGLALPYFIVVMTVRYFLEILIFLSPIPFLDAFFEFAQKVATFFLVVIFFFFPTFGFILSILIFFVAFLFFQRAKKVTNFFQYVYVQPLLSRIRGKSQELVSEKAPSRIKKQFPNASVVIRCLTGKKLGNISSKTKVWLVKSGDDLFLYQPKFFVSPAVFEIPKSLSDELRISQELYYQIIDDSQNQFKILINSTHKNISDQISNELNLENMGKVGLAKQKEILSVQGKKGLQKLLSIFNFKQITANKDAILDE